MGVLPTTAALINGQTRLTHVLTPRGERLVDDGVLVAHLLQRGTEHPNALDLAISGNPNRVS
jgi:hypothetical protein